ncbi:MAG: uL15 family ribosomal protein [Alphaproteobacteria bacterium]|nr:uL15 family ribosomal protein [Alphaproteobacteria bacterium]
MYTFTFKNKKSRRFGRGGSRGKTSGRGGKGQTARAGHSVKPAIRDFIQSLPKLRGHGKNRALSVDAAILAPQAIALTKLEAHFNSGDKVTPAILSRKHLIKKQKGKIRMPKIVGTGTLTKKLTVRGCFYTENVKKIIEKLGGTIR